MPPNNVPRVGSYWDRYPTPDEPPPTRFWVDSPLDIKQDTQQPQKSRNDSVHPLNNPPQNGKAKPSLPVREPKNEKKQQGLRFFNVTDPKELKDRGQLKLNRQHVMQDYLDKERLKPAGERDVRVDGAGAAIKRKRSRIQIPTPFGPGLTVDAPAARKDLPTPESSSHSDREAEHQHNTPNQTGRRKRHQEKSRRTEQSPPGQGAFQLVKGLNGSFKNARYLGTQWQDVPWGNPASTVGGALNPFDSWPTFSDADINVSALKWSCSRRFGSEGIAQYWVPELLRARHAFLSTICISSAHDDIMNRANQADPPHWLATREGLERLRVRGEVIAMVNQSLQDPEMRVSDATMISVLHLLNSEIMGCDDRVMKTHQDGLHRMVRQRGGLEGLGAGGMLARILTITMYIIAALRESHPHPEFTTHAAKISTPILKHAGRMPESPLYCPSDGYRTIAPDNCTSSQTWDLLNTLREVTASFQFRQDSQRTSPNYSIHDARLKELHTRIFALPAATDESLDFSSPNARYIYEALRLTARLYTHALYTLTPFSTASANLSATTSPSTSPDDLPSKSLPLQIRAALLRTDLSSCWGPLAGTLFFIALLAGAAANPGPYLWNEEREGEEEDGRKFLAAVVVRCSIVLSFEHGGAVMEMLRRLVEVEGCLREASDGRVVRDGEEDVLNSDDQWDDDGTLLRNGQDMDQRAWDASIWTSEPGIGTFVDGKEMFGPEVPPSTAGQWEPWGWPQQWDGDDERYAEDWTGMRDFAREFEALG